MSDFNSEPDKTFMSYFIELYKFKRPFKVPACLKNPEKPSCVDLFLTNRSGCFQHNHVFE